MIETGTATSGMIDARHVCRKSNDDEHDQHHGFEQRVNDRLDGSAHELRRVVDDRCNRRLRACTVFSSAIVRADVVGDLRCAFEPGDWKIGMATG